MKGDQLINIAFPIYALAAILIGLFTKRGWAAFVGCLLVGALICILLPRFHAYLEMGGILHAWAFAGLSLVVWKCKKVWSTRKNSK
jgi:hypothetical protein